MHVQVLHGSGVDFMQGEVNALDLDGGLITVREAGASRPRQLPFDQCVLALGMQTSLGNVPGASDHAQPFYTLDDALQVLALPMAHSTSSDDSQHVTSSYRSCGSGGGRLGGGRVGVYVELFSLCHIRSRHSQNAEFDSCLARRCSCAASC